jgi:polysaccharide biosynthesis protein PelA
MSIYRCIAILLAGLVLSGCLPGSPDKLNNPLPEGAWVVLPFENESTSLSAVQSAQAIAGEQLSHRGVSSVFDSAHPDAADKATYALAGKVEQWRYSSLPRPRPDVAIELQVFNTKTNEIVWQKKHRESGMVGESVISVANAVLSRLVSDISIPSVDERVAKYGDSSVGAVSEQLMPAVSSNQSEVTAAAMLAGQDAIRRSPDVPIDTDSAKRAYTLDQFAPGGSIALYYATKPPVRMLNEFDRVVLEAEAVTDSELEQFNAGSDVHSALFAYLSVGEVGPTRSWRSTLDPSWVLGVNGNWNSEVMDLANPGWRAFLMRRVDQLKQRGFEGFFLDTMDSYHLVAKTEAEKQRQQDGLVTFIASVKAKHPSVRFIANRGFELLPRIAEHLEVIAAESLYARWHGASGGYQAVPENDRTWLLGQLLNARNRYGLEALSIDYVEPGKRDDARKVAGKIAEHGVIPWVSTPGLDQVGLGLTEVFPREVIMLYDSKIDGPVEQTLVHRMVAMPIEYFGYVPKYIDLAKQSLPTGNLAGQYAGIVSWSDSAFNNTNWSSWLQAQVNHGVPYVSLGYVGAGASVNVITALGLKRSHLTPGVVNVAHATKLIGFERQPSPRLDYLSTPVRSVSADHDIQLAFTDSKQSKLDAVAYTPWGAYGVTPGLIDVDPNGNLNWVVEPFEFFKRALRLQNIPQPDITTQTGRRIATAHIDGDALPSWAEMPGKRLGAEVLHDVIIGPYKFPQSISIVEGEMVGMEAFADRRERMFSAMRAIFAEPHVELATHTYSHPFSWQLIKPNQPSGKYNLKVPDYAFSYEREIDGSIDFINQNLAPAGKEVAVVFWSGNAIPGPEALARVEALGLPNINGGFTTISKAFPTLSRIYPMMRPAGEYEQVYAHIMNENVYTNEWLGPFDGFRRVIETFEMTDHPKRIKPIGIYYHFYTGTKISAVLAMREVYDWTIAQDIAPLFVSDYAKRIKEFRSAQVSRSMDGYWRVSGLNQVQSIRWLDKREKIDIASSAGVAGQRHLHDGLYIHPTSTGAAKFRAQEIGSLTPYLVSSNGRLRSWEKNLRSLDFRVEAEVPVEVVLQNANGCQLSGPHGSKAGVNTDSGLKYTFTQKDTGDVSLRCPA